MRASAAQKYIALRGQFFHEGHRPSEEGLQRAEGMFRAVSDFTLFPVSVRYSYPSRINLLLDPLTVSYSMLFSITSKKEDSTLHGKKSKYEPIEYVKF